MAPQATECLPAENCSNCCAWHTAQLRGETPRRTRLSSHAVAAEVIAGAASLTGMWHCAQATPAPKCLLNCQSRRALPVIPLLTWHLTQARLSSETFAKSMSGLPGDANA